MPHALPFLLMLLVSQSPLAMNNGSSRGNALDRNDALSYKDIALNAARVRYYLSTLTLRLGLPAYTSPPFEEDMRVFPKDVETLRHALTVNTRQHPASAAIKVAWEGDALTIQIDPQLKATHLDDEALLQSALTLIQQANNNKLPIINGRALKAALEKKDGIPVKIFKRR
ncbi:MAG: hypothetical protein QX197_16865 [Methylococcaceae bacterium]